MMGLELPKLIRRAFLNGFTGLIKAEPAIRAAQVWVLLFANIVSKHKSGLAACRASRAKVPFFRLPLPRGDEYAIARVSRGISFPASRRVLLGINRIQNIFIPSLFTALFSNCSLARARHQGGTGLGLAICKHSIEAHKQSISVPLHAALPVFFSFTLAKG